MTGYRDINGNPIYPIITVRHGARRCLLTRGELLSVKDGRISVRVDRSALVGFDLAAVDVSVEEVPA